MKTFKIKINNFHEFIINTSKQLNLFEIIENNRLILSCELSTHQKAVEIVKKYNCGDFDISTLHNKLYNLFGSYKNGVLWLAHNEEIIQKGFIYE